MKRPTARPQTARRASVRESERGQVLIMFVAVFSVMLAMGAFAFDQGLWLGHRRIAQKDADVAARSGAVAFVRAGGVYDPASVLAAQDDARLIAERNGIAKSLPTCAAGSDAECATYKAKPDCEESSDAPAFDGAGVPSVEVSLTSPTRSLFAGLFGIGDVATGAAATACVGSVTAIGPGLSPTIPINLRLGDQHKDKFTDIPDTCFGGANYTTLVMGTECQFAHKSDSTLSLPSAGFCEGGSGNPNDVEVGIRDGISSNFVCKINNCPLTAGGGTACASTACDGSTEQDCVTDRGGAIGQNDVDDGFKPRLQNSTAPLCSSSMNALTNFRATFDRADGGTVNGPPAFGGFDAPGTVYVQKNCNAPRLVIVIITDSAELAVKGFATVFIVGCQDPPLAPPTTTLDDCSGVTGFGNIGIRGVPLKAVLTDDTVGGIGPPDPNVPLAILMFK